jgi:hypothetical protein
VLLHVSAPPRRVGHRAPAGVSVTVATCLFLAWLLAITLVSAWAGWQVGAGAEMDVALTPVVPRAPVPDAAGPDPPPLPSGGTDPAAPGPAGAFESPVTVPAPGPAGAFESPVTVPSMFIDGGHDARPTADTPQVPRSRPQPDGDMPPARAGTEHATATATAMGQDAVTASDTAATPTEAPAVASAGTPSTDDPAAPTATVPVPSGSEDRCPTVAASSDDEVQESGTSADGDSEDVDEDSADQSPPGDWDDDESSDDEG